MMSDVVGIELPSLAVDEGNGDTKGTFVNSLAAFESGIRMIPSPPNPTFEFPSKK